MRRVTTKRTSQVLTRHKHANKQQDISKICAGTQFGLQILCAYHKFVSMSQRNLHRKEEAVASGKVHMSYLLKLQQPNCSTLGQNAQTANPLTTRSLMLTHTSSSLEESSKWACMTADCSNKFSSAYARKAGLLHSPAAMNSAKVAPFIYMSLAWPLLNS